MNKIISVKEYEIKMLRFFACCPVLAWLSSFRWVLRFPPQSKSANVNWTQWTARRCEFYPQKKWGMGFEFFPNISLSYGIHGSKWKSAPRYVCIRLFYHRTVNENRLHFSPVHKRTMRLQCESESARCAVTLLRPSAILYLTNFESWFKFIYRQHGIEKRNNSQDWNN